MRCPFVRSDLRKLRDFNTSLYEAENVTPSRLEVEHWRLFVTLSHHCRCWLAGSARPSRVCRIAAPSNQTASGRNYYNLELNKTQLLTAFRKSCFCAKTQLHVLSCAILGQCCVYQVLGCAFFSAKLCLSRVQWFFSKKKTAVVFIIWAGEGVMVENVRAMHSSTDTDWPQSRTNPPWVISTLSRALGALIRTTCR